MRKSNKKGVSTMKKLIAIIISLVMLLTMAACAPSEGTTDPATDAPTEKPTEKPTEAPTNAPTDPEPTDPPAPTDPEPTDPPTLQDAGYCAVGIIDAEAGTAKILADNGVVAEISYTSEEEIVPGNIYEFAKNGDVYQLTSPDYFNPGGWPVRTYDNAGVGNPDMLYTHDGYFGRMYPLDENCVVFIRYSETEYRIMTGNECIGLSDFPCYIEFVQTPTEEEIPSADGTIYDAGIVHLIFVAGDPGRNKVHADEAQSSFFDLEGYGWPDGDLIIE
jgi:hypothetical protein